jgi:UDP-2-acetamido-3-amino-2,3-dideoxy-glucuronate N-acetyltransferase
MDNNHPIISSRSTLSELTVPHKPVCIADDVVIGKDVVIYGFANLYGCIIGDGTRIGPFVEIQKNVRIGRLCKIQSHSFICEGVTIDDEVFIGHRRHVHQRSLAEATIDGRLQGPGDWQLLKTYVGRGATIGSGAIILAGIKIAKKP